MTFPQRRESTPPTRFLLALSLSTVTAAAVAAPLAIQAVRADEPTFASGDALTDEGASSEAPLALEERRIDGGGQLSQGGIGTRPSGAKAQAQTTKSDEADPEPAADNDTGEAVLTNPSEETTSSTTSVPETTSSTSTTSTLASAETTSSTTSGSSSTETSLPTSASTTSSSTTTTVDIVDPPPAG